MLSIALVDDDAVVLSAISFLLAEAGMNVLWETVHPLEVLTMLSQSSKIPDVLIVDILMPELDGYELVRAVRSVHFDLPVLMLTSLDEESTLLKALAAGATGYIVKSDSPGCMVAAVNAAAAGLRSFTPKIDFSAKVSRSKDRSLAIALARLTPKEVEVLSLMARSLSNMQIADALFVTPETVKHHVSSVLAKLGVNNRLAAVMWAIKNGVVDITSY